MATQGEIAVNMKEVLDYSRLMGTFIPTLQNIVERKTTADAAKKQGLKVSSHELQRGADTLRYVSGLTSAKATQKWMAIHGISPDMLEEFLETSILVSKFKDHLVASADQAKYLTQPQVTELVRDLVYEDWLKDNLG